MRTVYVQELMRLPLGKQGENGAARIVWQGLAARYQALYGSGAFTLTAKRCGDAAAYPVAVSTEGGDVVWLVRAADVANPGSGSCELTYTVDGAVAKSQTWSTYVAASISGDAPGEPPEEPAKAWFAAIQAQIGNLDDLTTKARASLVAAINEAAKTGSGGGVDIDLGMTGAAAGQVAKVKAVDADGKPTAWEPADMAGMSNDWMLLADITLAEDSAVIKIDKTPSGGSFSIRELAFFGGIKCDTENKILTLSVNGKIGYGNPTIDFGQVLNAAESGIEHIAAYVNALPECLFARVQHNQYNSYMSYNTPSFAASYLRDAAVIAHQLIGNPITVFAIAPWAGGKSGVFKAGTSLKFYGR